MCQRTKNKNLLPFSIFFYAQESTSGHLFSPLCMDKWGVAQNADQDTSGMRIKYGTSDACADRFRQPNYSTWPMTGFPKSGWLNCCSTEMSRNRKEYFSIIVKTWVEFTSLRLRAYILIWLSDVICTGGITCTIFYPHAAGILACALSNAPFIDNL